MHKAANEGVATEVPETVTTRGILQVAVELAPITIILVGLGLVGLLLIGPGCGPPL